MEKQKIIKQIDGALFLSKEDEDRIEHVDISYSKLMELLMELAK